jgi:HAD superfamily hydrolase (TIGR01490 family)
MAVTGFAVSSQTHAEIQRSQFSIMKKKLVLFDFDGTITTKDTLIELLLYYRGVSRFLLGLFLLSPVLIPYFFSMLPNWKAKQYFLRWYLGGEKLEDFNARCKEFSLKIIPKLIRKDALETIQQLKREHATIIVISASAENWVKPWCDENNLICLATQLEVKDNMITGNFLGKNCYGEEKVNRVKEAFNLSDFDPIIAYGDSNGDREMFAISHQHYYKPFRN